MVRADAAPTADVLASFAPRAPLRLAARVSFDLRASVVVVMAAKTRMRSDAIL